MPMAISTSCSPTGDPARRWRTKAGESGYGCNNGAATFVEVTDMQMPSTLVRFCWELELVDVDNDWDLDLAVSAKRSETSFLYENDGTGTFTDVTADRLPHFTNNYDFEAMDLDGDGYLDLVTINDGDNVTGEGGREHVFRNDGSGGFEDVTTEWWPNEANPGEDDNNIVFLDVDSDGDADFLVGSLTGPDRLMINDGSGHLSLESAAFDAPVSAGTLGMTVADLDNDGRLDVVEAQGENPNAEDERVYLATDALAPDTGPPVVVTDLDGSASGAVTVHARVHDFMVHRLGRQLAGDRYVGRRRGCRSAGVVRGVLVPSHRFDSGRRQRAPGVRVRRIGQRNVRSGLVTEG